MSDQKPVRLPDAATVEAILKNLDPASADVNLASALSASFPDFSFSTAVVDDFYWRGDTRAVLDADGNRLGEHHAWVERELANLGGDLTAFWNRHRESGHKFAEWRGSAVFAFAPTGPGVADFVQLSLGREIEVLAGPVVDPGFRPWGVEDLFEPSWVEREPATDVPILAGPAYRISRRAGLIHMRSFLGIRRRLEREQQEARRPELEARIIREVALDSVKDTPFLELNPGWFEFVPRENRFFVDWARSSASIARIFEHWAFDITDYEQDGRRQISFIPRPLKLPTEKLLAGESVSVHWLMERVEAIDAEVGLRFAWFFLMTHGHWVDPDVGAVIADGLRAGRVRLPDRDAIVLLDWAHDRYLF